MAAKRDGAGAVTHRRATCSGGRSSEPCPSSTAGGGGGDLQCRRERMEDVEMDAARALADFRHMALLEREGRGRAEGGSGGGREERGPTGDSERSSTKRTKNPREAGVSWMDASSASPGRQQARDGIDYRYQEVGERGADGKVGTQSSCAVGKLTSRWSPKQGKQNLSEAEKEAKRLRRVLANRESARQTILKRKAVCEELMKKIAELSQENENMKMEREEVMKEYVLLKDRNMQLKAQVAKSIERETKTDPCVPTSTPSEPPASSPTTHPMLMHGVPPLPHFMWPYVVKPSNSANAVSQSASLCQEQGIASLPRSGFLVPQCPWLCPFLYQPVYPTGHEGGPSRGGEHPIWRVCKSASSSRREGFAKEEKTTEPVEAGTKKTEDATDDTEVLRPSQTGTAVAFETHSSATFPAYPRNLGSKPGSVRGAAQHPRRKLRDASAAAEARRKRKELTKLKHVHSWQGRSQR